MIVASTLVLATIACGAQTSSSPPPATIGSVATSPAAVSTQSAAAARPSGSQTLATIQLGPATDVPALGRGTRSVSVVGSSTFWITDDRTAPEHSLIVVSEPPALPQILFTPLRSGAHFQVLTVGREWMAWVEHVENQTWKDARIYVARRGGQPILIDDMAHYGGLATFPELALDNSDLYWTVPEIVNGVWRGRLLHRNLLADTTETVETGDDTVFTWPAAANGVLAYEVAKRQGSPGISVRYRTAGRVIDIAGPASEPAVGADYLLFKRGERFDPGTIESVSLSTQKSLVFGHGEAPRTDGAVAVWFDSNLNEALVARPADGCSAISTANRGRADGIALLSSAVGGMRLAWSGLSNANGVISEFVRTATIERITC